jgi:hypothetical protein
MHVNGFDCHALCDLGASISIMPRKIYDMLGLPLLEKSYFDVPIADVAKKKPLGRINDVHIIVNNNLVPVDFLIMNVECNASCPIILGRPFLQIVGAIIDMKEALLNINSHLRKVCNTSIEGGRNYFLTLFLQQIMNLMLHRLILLDFHFLRRVKEKHSWEITHCFLFSTFYFI